jgi:hypothetical protein
MTAVNLQNKTGSTYSAADLAKLEASLEDYWDRSRHLESDTVKDLEKHLWLANGAAATISIGFVQAKHALPIWQYAGAWAFVAGILILVVMKFVSALNSSRDRYRFEDAKSRFDAEEVTDYVFRGVRDRMSRVLKRSYLILQWSAGVAFIAGCILTLIGVASAV